MASSLDELFAGVDEPASTDDLFAGVDLPEQEAQVTWAGRPTTMAAIRDVAERHGVSPNSIMRLDSTPGKIETFLAKSELGSTALRLSEGMQSVADTLVSGGARGVKAFGLNKLVGVEDKVLDNISDNVHNDRRSRQEFLSLIEKGGAIEQTLGSRAGRIFNQTVSSLGEIGTVGTLTGPLGVYSYTAGSAWDSALDEGERAGLSGAELQGYAARSAAIEGGLTMLMGKAGKAAGLESLEESLSPAARSVVRNFLNSPTMRDKMKVAARELGGWGAEGVEELLIAGGQQANDVWSGTRSDFDWNEVLDAGAGGVFGRGSVGAMKDLSVELNKFQKNLPEIVAGVRDAEIDLERGVNPFEVNDIEDAAEFEKQTGRKGTSPERRDSYRETLNFYVAEMRREGKTGALAKMEEDVKKLREEERQRAARIAESKAKAAAAKPEDADEPATNVVSQEEIDALDNFMGSQFESVNKFLRGQKEPNPEELPLFKNTTKGAIEKLDSLLKKLPEKTQTTYRGVSFNSPEVGAEFISRLKPGETFSDKGFMSTSVREDIAREFGQNYATRVLFTVTGKSGKDVSGLAGIPGEGEVLFPRDTKFIIKSVKPAADQVNLHEIELQEVEAELKSPPLTLNKGRAGESTISTEPVQEPPMLTANERATFSAKEFENNILLADPRAQKTIDVLTAPEPKINPLILAPWEPETRAQRTIRAQRRKVGEQKETIAGLRLANIERGRLTAEQQNTALELIQENIPKNEQHGFFKGVLAATRPSAINKLLNRVTKHVEQREKNLAIKELKESFKKAGNLRQEFADQVKEIRSQVDLKKFRGAEVAESIKKWVAENPAAILDEHESGLLDRLAQQNVHGMTTDDILELAARVEQLAYESAAQDRLIGNEQSASVKDTADRLAASTEKAPRREFKSDSILGGDDKKRTLASQALHEWAERPEVTLRALSPELSEATYGEVTAARSNYKLRAAQTAQHLSGVFNQLGLTHDVSLNASLDYMMGRPGTKLEEWRSKERVIAGHKLNRDEAGQIVLWWNDPEARRRLMAAGVEFSGGRKIERVTPAVLRDIADFIGPEGLTIAAQMFEQLNTFVIDGVNDANIKMTGRALTDKKNVVPIVKADQDYAKLVSDKRGGRDAVADSYSHLKRRGSETTPLAVPEGMGMIDMYMTHADRMHRFSAYALTARNMELLLNDKVLKKAIVAKNGEQGYNQIVDAIRSEVAGYPPPDATSSKLAKLNHSVAGAMIGAKLSIIAGQPLDLLVSKAYEQNGFENLGEGLAEMNVRGPGKTYKEMKEFLSANSGEWNGRYESGRYSGELTNGIFRQKSFFRPSSLVEHATDPLMKAEQVSVALPNYLAAKAEARRQLGLAPEDYKAYDNDPQWKQLVTKLWEQAMVRGSNSSDGMELSSSLRYAKKNPFAGLMMNFYNTAGKVYSLFTSAQGQWDQGNKREAMKFAAAGMANVVFFSALQTAMSTGEKDKEKYDFWGRLLIRTSKNVVGMNPLGGIVGVEQVINKAAGLPTFTDNPVLLADAAAQAAMATADLTKRIIAGANEDDDPDKLTKLMLEFGRTTGPLLAVPTPAAVDVLERVRKGSLFPGLAPAEKKSKKKTGSLMQGAL